MSIQEQAPRDARWRAMHDQVKAIRAAVPSLAGSLSSEQFNWQPAPDRWSIGQNLQHVVLVGRDYFVPLDMAIAEAKERSAAGRPPYRQGVIGTWLVRSQEPPVKRRIRTLRRMHPPASLECDVVLAEFDAFHQELERRMEQTRDVDLDAGRMRSPLLRLVRLTVGQAMAGLLGHSRRHLWHVEQIRGHSAFPH